MPYIYDVERCICRNHVHYDLYIVTVHGCLFSVMVTNSAAAADMWVDDVLSRRSTPKMVVALGTQVTQFQRKLPVLDTMQLCVEDRCLIFQLSRAPIMSLGLRQFLLNPVCIFVGFQNYFDKKFLLSSKHAVFMRDAPLDLRRLTDDYVELTNMSLDEIIVHFLGYAGVRRNVNVFMSDWGVPVLSHDQVLQAAFEARCKFLLATLLPVWQYR